MQLSLLSDTNLKSVFANALLMEKESPLFLQRCAQIHSILKQSAPDFWENEDSRYASSNALSTLAQKWDNPMNNAISFCFDRSVVNIFQDALQKSKRVTRNGLLISNDDLFINMSRELALMSILLQTLHSNHPSCEPK